MIPVNSERATELTVTEPVTLFSRGSIVYYGPLPTVSASAKTGSLADGESVVLTRDTWVRSAGSSLVELQALDNEAGGDWEDGDLVSAQAALNVAGYRADVRAGTTAVPLTVVAPILHVSRKEKITRTSIQAITGSLTSDAAAGLAAIHGSSAGMAGTEAQAVGVFGGATNESNVETENSEPDAAGVYGLGRITAGTSSHASCYGGVFYGRRDVTTAIGNGVEIGVQNYTATPEEYKVAGTTPGGKCRGIWMTPSGESDSSVGLVIDNPFGLQFDVGIAAGASVGGGKTGAIKSAFIRDDSKGKRSILIKGEHEEGALVVAKGSGAILLGTETVSSFVSSSGTLLDVVSEAASTGIAVRNTGASNTAVQVSNSVGDIRLATAGGAGAFWTGSAEGDSGLIVNASKTIHIGRSGGVRAPLRVSNNVGIGASADSFGGGVGVVFLANATTAPSTNPTAGGVLYCEAGKLMYRGSSGTVKELATA